MEIESSNSTSYNIGDSDRKILNELDKGRCTPGALSDWTGLSRTTVHYCLKSLQAGGHVNRVHQSGLYELNEEMMEGDSHGD